MQDFLPHADPPPDTWDTMEYGQQAADTHPTWMHSCLSWFKIAGVAHCYDSDKSLTVPAVGSLIPGRFYIPDL